GLQLTPQEAFRWLSHGGVDDIPGQFVIGGLGLSGIKSVQKRFTHNQTDDVRYLIDGMNTFNLDLNGAQKETMALPFEGEVQAVPVFVRGSARFPITGYYAQVFAALQQHRFIDGILRSIQQSVSGSGLPTGISFSDMIAGVFSCLESMVAQGWVRASFTEGRPALAMSTPDEGDIVYTENLGPASSKRSV
ncbi:MAG: hypothetical protein U0930_11620, partial [Pirellulales bacterium]